MQPSSQIFADIHIHVGIQDISDHELFFFIESSTIMLCCVIEDVMGLFSNQIRFGLAPIPKCNSICCEHAEVDFFYQSEDVSRLAHKS